MEGLEEAALLITQDEAKKMAAANVKMYHVVLRPEQLIVIPPGFFVGTYSANGSNVAGIRLLHFCGSNDMQQKNLSAILTVFPAGSCPVVKDLLDDASKSAPPEKLGQS